MRILKIIVGYVRNGPIYIKWNFLTYRITILKLFQFGNQECQNFKKMLVVVLMRFLTTEAQCCHVLVDIQTLWFSNTHYKSRHRYWLMNIVSHTNKDALHLSDCYIVCSDTLIWPPIGKRWLCLSLTLPWSELFWEFLLISEHIEGYKPWLLRQYIVKPGLTLMVLLAKGRLPSHSLALNLLEGLTCTDITTKCTTAVL